MFEQASKLKLRFESPKGPLSVEDLWDLPLTSERGASLDGIAKAINKKLKESAEESFVTPKATSKNTVLQLSLDILKHIIAVRVAENEKTLKAREDKEKKDRILEIIDRKKNQQLEAASIEELEALAKSL